MNTVNVMLDLETWSTAPNAVITSIGAVKFNLNPDNSGGKIVDEFYYRINPQSCIDVGLQMSVDTILWWMKQTDDARAEFQKPTRSIQDVLVMFSTWLGYDPKHVDIWGNGSDFDNVLLASAYRACKNKLPWIYPNNRCYRTLKNLYPNVLPKSLLGVKHNALDDAKYQTNHLIDILCYINRSSVSNLTKEEIQAKIPKKETVRIALPSKSDYNTTLLQSGLPSNIELWGQYDDSAYEKLYNTPCSMRSADDTIKGMNKAKEIEFIEGNDKGKKVVDKTRK